VPVDIDLKLLWNEDRAGAEVKLLTLDGALRLNDIALDNKLNAELTLEPRKVTVLEIAVA
jgi:hypothetical protein